MGLTFHYSGKLKNPASLNNLIEEVQDVANAYQWPSQVLEEAFPNNEIGTRPDDNLYGICFSPPGCEPVCFTFLANGRFSSPLLLQCWLGTPEQDKYLYGPFVKTQYAGPEVHIVVIELFKYLAPKYFTEFKLYDEGEYWETGDREKLFEAFERFGNAIKAFGDALENTTKKPGESTEDFIQRIFKALQKRNHGDAS